MRRFILVAACVAALMPAEPAPASHVDDSGFNNCQTINGVYPYVEGVTKTTFSDWPSGSWASVRGKLYYYHPSYRAWYFVKEDTDTDYGTSGRARVALHHPQTWDHYEWGKHNASVYGSYHYTDAYNYNRCA
jgi:hypothetical protein